MKKLLSILFSITFLLVFVSFFSQKSLAGNDCPSNICSDPPSQCAYGAYSLQNAYCIGKTFGQANTCCNVAPATVMTCSQLVKKFWSLSGYSCMSFDKCDSSVRYSPPGTT